MSKRILILTIALALGAAVQAQKLERIAPPPPPPAAENSSKPAPPPPPKVVKSKTMTPAERIKARRMRAIGVVPPPPPPAVIKD